MPQLPVIVIIVGLFIDGRIDLYDNRLYTHRDFVTAGEIVLIDKRAHLAVASKNGALRFLRLVDDNLQP